MLLLWRIRYLDTQDGQFKDRDLWLDTASLDPVTRATRAKPTANRPIEDWGKLIGDVPAATAILDRFLHHAEVITITGKSYRLKNRQAVTDQACKKAGK